MRGNDHRGRFAGTRMILRYNWPLYLTGAGTAVAGAITARAGGVSRRVRTGAAVAATGAGWLSVASLGASWWVYDRSELYRWSWLHRVVARPPRRVLVLHAGLDEASEPLARTWANAAIEAVDVHGGVGRTTASLARARAAVGTAPATSPNDDRADVDVAVAFLAAHELRSRAARSEVLRGVAGRLRPGGRLVLVEHVRDVANTFAFGPAVGHFYPVGEWRARIADAGLRLASEERITPFVVVLVAEKAR